ncbi:Rrf2 family transcriptional regulator [Nitrococcus mobilis]|nr:Rrf2 family transcriptional regulator [Nitrococcus mobilis]
MRLTSFTDYSLRVLMYLSLKENELSTISEIAERYAISRNHLMKVVYELGRLGYVETVRGKHGGMRLRHSPASINLGEVVRRTENDMALVECFSSQNYCRLTPSCVLHGVLREALQAFLAVLDRYSLADLLEPKQKLANLLAIEIPVRVTSSTTPPPKRA